MRGVAVALHSAVARRAHELGSRTAVVVMGRRLTPDGFDVVRAADGVGVAMAVEHLVGLGHRRIVHVDGGDAAMADDRRAGFLAAAADVEALVIPGGYDEAAGSAAARVLLDDLPTAVVAANDRSAIGLLDVFVRAGVRVPQDVSVVGYDDSALARLAHVDLTTISQESHLQAERAVAAALDASTRTATTPSSRCCRRGSSSAAPRARLATLEGVRGQAARRGAGC